MPEKVSSAIRTLVPDEVELRQLDDDAVQRFAGLGYVVHVVEPWLPLSPRAGKEARGFMILRSSNTESSAIEEATVRLRSLQWCLRSRAARS